MFIDNNQIFTDGLRLADDFIKEQEDINPNISKAMERCRTSILKQAAVYAIHGE